jgi:hypothetical protein
VNDLGSLDPAFVDERAIRGTEILDQQPRVGGQQFGVSARDLALTDDEIALGMAAHDRFVTDLDQLTRSPGTQRVC